jgi:hypothetical protein
VHVCMRARVHLNTHLGWRARLRELRSVSIQWPAAGGRPQGCFHPWGCTRAALSRANVPPLHQPVCGAGTTPQV